MHKKIKVSKLDAARRQLETAIKLYFVFGDPISIHTLSAAAYNVIRDLNTKKDGDPLLMKDELLNYIKEGHEHEVRNLINAAENFFKHADRDHDGVLDFNPDQSEFLILEACSAYHSLTGENPPVFKLYNSWFITNHSNLFNFPDEKARLVAMRRDEVIELGREEYFNQVLPIVMRLHA